MARPAALTSALAERATTSRWSTTVSNMPICNLIAEAYDLFKTMYGLDATAIAKIFEQWKTGDLDSYLIEITAVVLNKRDEKTGGALVAAILDEAEPKGHGPWTARNALDLGVP